MTYADNEFNEIFQKLMEEHPIDEMVKFDNTNIQDKLSDNAFLVVKYKELYLKERATYDKINALKDKEAGRIYQGLKFPKALGQEKDKWIADRAHNDIRKDEIEKYYVPTHPNIIKLDRLLKLQEARVNFFDLCVDALTKMGWSMKNFLEAERM